jgi:hypothetical protein
MPERCRPAPGARVALLFAVITCGAYIGAAQQAGLKIVVIEGDDAVNIIQQRTAVAPIVEVRDRNDQPVSGAAVRFLINGNKAAFPGGAPTLNVTTDAAGRAAATGLTPSSSGSLDIAVTATHDAETATAHITQTNFATVQQAARAGRTPGQSSGGNAAAGAGAAVTAGVVGGAGASGGLSATTLAVIGGAAAAGGILVAKAVGGSNADTSNSGPTTTTYAGPFSGTGTVSASSSGDGITESCDFVWSQTGTLRLTLTQQSGNATVSGMLSGDGTQSGRVASCTEGIVVPCPGCDGPWAITAPVNGTTSSLQFSQTQTVNIQGGTCSGGLTFSGALNGNTVSGTYAQDGRCDLLQAGFRTTSTSSMRVPVTLQR